MTRHMKLVVCLIAMLSAEVALVRLHPQKVTAAFEAD